MNNISARRTGVWDRERIGARSTTSRREKKRGAERVRMLVGSGGGEGRNAKERG